MYIHRHWTTHGKYYLKKCAEHKIEPNKAAVPSKVAQESNELGLVQPTINDFIKSAPKWSKEGLLEHLVDFVVSGDQVCYFT